MNGIEDKYFSWNNWDEGCEYGDLQFYDCVLKEDMGEFKKGTYVQQIYLSLSESYFEISLNEDYSKKYYFEVVLKEDE